MSLQGNMSSSSLGKRKMSMDSLDGLSVNVTSGELLGAKLDFTDCILDSPNFRDTLKVKYSKFREINHHFKTIIKCAQTLKEQQKKYHAAYHSLLAAVNNHPVPQGDSMTHDEFRAFDSIKEFVDIIKRQEDAALQMQSAGLDNLVGALQNYQEIYSNQIKEKYKSFEKITEKHCHNQEKYLSVSTKKKDQQASGAQPPSAVSNSSFEDLDRNMAEETRQFHHESTDFVWCILETEERLRTNYIQNVYDFTRSYLASFIWTYLENVKRFQEFYPFIDDVISSSRKQLEITAHEAKALQETILRDPQAALENREEFYDREGYLWMLDKRKNSSKHFCQYRSNEKQLTMTQYHQVNPPKHVNVTLQAQSSEDRAQWLAAMDGQEPIYEDWRKFKRLGGYELDRNGLDFIKLLIKLIETKGGLDQEGAYRRPGGAKKVEEFINAYFVDRDITPILNDPAGVEVKTMTSALKKFLGNLKDPLIPYPLYYKLINVVRAGAGTGAASELDQIHAIIHQLPDNHFQALKLIISHLNKIVGASEVTLMDVTNMATCVGTSLLHSEGASTIANVMEIKFVNSIITTILSNYSLIFETEPLLASPKARDRSSSKMPEGAGAGAGAGQGKSSSLDSLTDSHPSGSEHGKSGPGPAARPVLGKRPTSLQTSSGQSSAKGMKNSTSTNQISPSASASTGGETTPSRTNAVFNPPKPSNVASSPSFPPKNTCVRALYDNSGPDVAADELSFQANQIITNVTISDEPGWLKGSLNGRVGLFPANYVQVVDPMDCLRIN